MDDRSSSADDPRLTPRLLRAVPRWVHWPLILVALVVSFSAGRYSGPAEVETRTEFVEVVRKVKEKAKTRDVIRYVKIVTQPDGTKTEERSEREATKTETKERSEAQTSATTATKTAGLPSWSLGALVGATWKEATPAPSALTFGPIVDLRLGKLPCYAGGALLLEVRAGAVTQGTAALTGRCVLP